MQGINPTKYGNIHKGFFFCANMMARFWLGGNNISTDKMQFSVSWTVCIQWYDNATHGQQRCDKYIDIFLNKNQCQMNQ